MVNCSSRPRESYMRSIWFLCCLVLAFCSLQCASGPVYWTYHQGIAPQHIIHPDLIPVWIDSNFTPSQAMQIEAAVDEWNQVFNGQIVMTVQTHQEQGVDKKMHTYPTTFANYDAGQKLVDDSKETNLGIVFFALKIGDKNLRGDDGTLAYVEGPGAHAVYAIPQRFGSRSLKDVMMHELAHLFGALHVNAPSLETPYYSSNQYDCIDKITVAQVAAMQHLDFNSLNYCVTPNFI